MTQFSKNNLAKQTKFRGRYRIESARLKNYDYSSAGAYFITICTKNREHFFGQIIDGQLQVTQQSKICLACWLDLPNHYVNCVLDAFVIMPNHVHGIVVIPAPIVETGLKPVSTTTTTTTTTTMMTMTSSLSPPKRSSKQYSISEIIRGFKTFTARKINDLQNTQGRPFWQSRFYDRIIRDEGELNRIRQYICDNPLHWENDRNNAEYLCIKTKLT